jgi:hypothetical protein
MSIVINSLPFAISSSGDYILGSDFLWADSSQSAITINASRVKLDFVGKKIQTNVASTFPIVSISGNIEKIYLKNIYLEAIESAVNSSAGIKIFGAKDVTLSAATLLNLGGNGLTSLYAEEVERCRIEGLNLRNTTSVVSISLFIYNSKYVKFYDSEVVNGRSVIRQCKNVSVKRLRSDNSASLSGSKGRCIQIDSLVGLTPVSPFPVAANQLSDGVKISHCKLVSGAGTGVSSIILVGIPLGFVINGQPSVNDFPIYNIFIENNECVTIGSESIYIQYVIGYEIFCNEILSENTGNPIGPDGPTKPAGIVLQTSSKGIVNENTVQGKNTADSLGISVQSSIPNYLSKNNLVECNKVEGFTYLYSDNQVNVPDTNAKYTVFHNNSITDGAKISILDPTTTYIPKLCKKYRK